MRRGALLLLICACTNARDEFDSFGDRVPDAAPPIDGEIVSDLPDVTGEFYMVARANLQEDRFLHFRVTYTFTPTGENTGLLDYSGYCLDLETLEPVGEPMSAEDAEVGGDGSFAAPLVGTVYAPCNSVAGTEIEADGMIHGNLLSADFVCGDMSGSAGGLPLEGTLWGAQRITGSELPAMIWRCEDAPTP